MDRFQSPDCPPFHKNCLSAVKKNPCDSAACHETNRAAAGSTPKDVSVPHDSEQRQTRSSFLACARQRRVLDNPSARRGVDRRRRGPRRRNRDSPAQLRSSRPALATALSRQGPSDTASGSEFRASRLRGMRGVSREIQNHLPYLKDLGVTTLWLTPV